jgi:hypothetical protein
MNFQYSDGGRSKAGYLGHTNDCVVRAIAIITEQPYQKVYDAINDCALYEKKAKLKKSDTRIGIRKQTSRYYLESLGWKWTPTMLMGSGCKVHLKSDELPSGRLIVKVSKHMVAVIDGVIHDTYDCSRNGTRCVYGYYTYGLV